MRSGFLFFLGLLVACSPLCEAQASLPAPEAPRANSLADWAGLQVVSVTFEGVGADMLAPLPSQLAQQPGGSAGSGQGTRQPAQSLRYGSLPDYPDSRCALGEQCFDYFLGGSAPVYRPGQRARRQRRSPGLCVAEFHPTAGGHGLLGKQGGSSGAGGRGDPAKQRLLPGRDCPDHGHRSDKFPDRSEL